MEKFVKFAVINNNIQQLMVLLQDIHEEFETLDNSSHEIFEYALGGLAYIQANFKDSDEKTQKVYELVVYNALHDVKVFKNLFEGYIKQPSFVKNPLRDIYNVIKTKYHNLYELVRIGQ
jgi:hypothetical protein